MEVSIVTIILWIVSGIFATLYDWKQTFGQVKLGKLIFCVLVGTMGGFFLALILLPKYVVPNKWKNLMNKKIF